MGYGRRELYTIIRVDRSRLVPVTYTTHLIVRQFCVCVPRGCDPPKFPCRTGNNTQWHIPG